MEIAGTTWTLAAFETDRDVIQALVEAPATISFSLDGAEKGTISGRSGCNRYFASYSLNNDHLSIGPIGATRMLCSSAQMNQESRYFQALATAGRCELGNEELLIDYNGGRLRFERATDKSQQVSRAV
jgi:heat shock protein HslJ